MAETKKTAREAPDAPKKDVSVDDLQELLKVDPNPAGRDDVVVQEPGEGHGETEVIVDQVGGAPLVTVRAKDTGDSQQGRVVIPREALPEFDMPSLLKGTPDEQLARLEESGEADKVEDERAARRQKQSDEG